MSKVNRTLMVGEDVVEVAPDNLPAAAANAKGAVKKGASVAKATPLDSELVQTVNGVLDSLRGSGALANTKFRVLYDGNTPVGAEEDADYIPEDKTVYEVEDTATVMFEDNDGSTPELYGYIFLGWALTPNAQTPDYPYDESDPQTYTLTFVDNDITLYAVWQLRTVTITYSLGVYGQGSVPAAQTVRDGAEAEISFSPAPTVNDGSGRFFVGWAYDDGGDSVEDVSFSLTGNTEGYFYDDTTLYPVFAAQYTLTYALGNDATGTVPSSETAYNGETVSIDFNPSVTCISDNTKVFVGWSTTDESASADYEADGTDTIYMTSNVTLYPVFAAAGGDDGFTIDATGSSEDIEIYYYDELHSEDRLSATITAGTSDDFTFNQSLLYTIRFKTSVSEMSAMFTGSYNDVGYMSEGLTVGDGGDTTVICTPDGLTNWDGSIIGSGTLVCIARNK